MLKKTSYLVTGGTGFIGSALVRTLVGLGIRVRVLDNDLRGVSARLSAVATKIELVKADIRDAQAVQKACSGIDCVIHLAYLNGTEFFYTKPELVLEIAVKGITNVIDGCIKEGVKELFLASSSEVYQAPPAYPTDECVSLVIPNLFNPRYSYGGGKIISELMAVNYGRKYFQRVVIIRPHNVYGPDMGWEHVIPQFVVKMKNICQAHPDKGEIEFSIQGTGKETRAFVFIDDFINGFLISLEKGKHLEIYNIGTMEEISIGEVAVLVGQYFDRKVRIIPGETPQGSTPRRCPDISKLKRLGYLPRVPFSEGVRIAAEWYDRNAAQAPPKRLSQGEL